MKATKATKVHQPTRQVGRIAGGIAADLKANKPKLIRPFDLRELGYQFHNTPKVVIKKGFELRLVLDSDTKREADFCFFIDTEKTIGVVLPHSFSHYVERSASITDGTLTNGASATSTTKG